MWDDLSPDRWRDDLDYLVAAVRREHRNPHHTVSPDGFARAIASLRWRLPDLAGHEVVVALARLMALVGDGHTVLRLTDVGGFGRVPIRLHRFSDGLSVRAITPDHASANGGRVIAIGDVPILEAWDRARPLVSRDNEMGVWQTVPDLLAIPHVLHALGIVPAIDRTTWTIERTSGEIVTLDLPTAPDRAPDLVDARSRLRMADPLWLRRSHENWFEHLSDVATLYLAYNTVRDGAPEPLALLFNRALDVAAREGIDRFVIDIRRNGGGNMALNWPLVDGLIRADRVNRWGHLFVIIGRGTFSAAMNLAVDLEARTRALFVGEPTAARPNGFGENVDIALPHSGLRATVSGLFWQNSLPVDDREWIAPDIPARLSSADYLGQRDPALDAILRYEHDPANDSDDPSNRLWRKLGRSHGPA